MRLSRNVLLVLAFSVIVLVVVVAESGRDALESSSRTTTTQNDAFERSLQRAPRIRSEPNPAVHDFRRHRRQPAMLAESEVLEGDETADAQDAFERSLQRMQIERAPPNPAVHDLSRGRRF